MKMLLHPAAVVVIRMRKQKRIHIAAAMFIAFEPPLKLRGDVRGVTFGVIGCGSYVDVNKDKVSVTGCDEGHVPIPHFEMRRLCSHCLNFLGLMNSE